MTRNSVLLFSLTLFLTSVGLSAPERRPLTHADYDGWKHIQNQHLSNDGTFLAYALFPQEGDGELIVRNLKTGKEYRESIGQLPPPPPVNFASNNEEGPPPPRGIEIAFTQNGQQLVFAAFPSKAEVDQAKKDKKKPQEMPKNGLRIMDLSSGSVFRAANVKSFQVPSKADGFVAYLHDAPGALPADAKPVPDGRPKSAAEVTTDRPARKKEYGGELVLRALPAGTERNFADVTEFKLTKNGKELIYAVSSKSDDTNGVYAVDTASSGAPKALLNGRGQYAKLVLDEEQNDLAFFADRAKQDARLYICRLGSAPPTDAVSDTTPGFPSGDLISDRSTIAFSKDGRHVFFGYAPKPAVSKQENLPAEDRVSVDLWHYKDDYIQPMQKVRAQVERTRSFRAVYNVPEKKLVVLADPTMQELTPSDDGRFSLGGDDREYRSMVEYDERYSDSYLVDNSTGTRKLLSKKHLGRVTWSPDARHVLSFNGKDWLTISVPDGKTTNLTANLGVRFWTEEHDSPGSPAPYGLAGWTKDSRAVLLYDHYDIWRIAPDGSAAQNITEGAGRKSHVMFRYVKLDADPTDPQGDSKWIDPSKPALLHAENYDTRDTGFYRARLDSPAVPEKLMMGPKNFSHPIKARNADVLVLTAQTFTDCPDLYTTDLAFPELHKVSDANPQQAGILWGTDELINYRNTDGVPLKATLYKPANFDPNKKYPMLVYIYERLTQNVHNYVEPRPTNVISVSYYVSNGYVVLEPDIVYKVGYPGQSALQCVLPAVQAVVDRGFINENAIGIEGHSWGGYQIAYMITQTTRFKAVEAGAPVGNMISAYGGIRWGPGLPRQFQYERTQSRIGGSPWEYPMRYIENSPIFMADRIKTPVLMIANDADDAVPWYQGIEFYLGLRRLGKEVYMFSYNGEPHNLRRRPNQKDFTVRMQQYFDYYLKGAPKPDWMEHGIPYLNKVGATPEPTDQ